jgi:hypothetical protein
LGGPTIWEVHEYVDGTPALAFMAGAGGHAAADEFGTTFYVEQESGWRDGAAMLDNSAPRLMADGAWTGPQYKQPFLVQLDGIWIAPTQEAMFASIRKSRNALGRQYRTGRLLAQDSDGKRLFADVVRGGNVLMTPSTSLVGTWSMSFKVDNPVYYSEEIRTSTVRVIGANPVGMGFPVGYPMAFQTSDIPEGGQVIYNGGDVPVPFVASIRGPLGGFVLIDGETGRTLTASVGLNSSQSVVLDTASKTFKMGSVNLRHLLSGQWFQIAPGRAGVVFRPLSAASANTACTIAYHAEAWGG